MYNIQYITVHIQYAIGRYNRPIPVEADKLFIQYAINNIFCHV